MNSPDILIIGGGVLGSSTSWHLATLGASEIVVIDLDLAGTFSSSELNAGGCRATWWNPINMEIAQLSIKFYETIVEQLQFFQKGYLFLYSPLKWKIALGKKSIYESLKIPVAYLSVSDLQKFIPEFENHKGIAGATYSPKDGLIDPHLVREYYRTRAKECGVHFIDHTYVQKIRGTAKRIAEVIALRHEASSSLGDAELEKILTTHEIPTNKNWQTEIFRPKIVINCTGAWLPVTSRMYQRPSPVKPIRRQISLFSSHQEDFSDRGMIVDTSGLYMHPEGSHTGLMLSGYSNRDEKPGYNFDYDGEPFFDKQIWLRLYRRGNRRHFSAIKHVRGWAGLYAQGPDRTGILWRVEGIDNLFELGAATGRGVMQSYALGRAMAELVVKGKAEIFDASLLSANRFKQGKFLYEDLDI